MVPTSSISWVSRSNVRWWRKSVARRHDLDNPSKRSRVLATCHAPNASSRGATRLTLSDMYLHSWLHSRPLHLGALLRGNRPPPNISVHVRPLHNSQCVHLRLAKLACHARSPVLCRSVWLFHNDKLGVCLKPDWKCSDIQRHHCR